MLEYAAIVPNICMWVGYKWIQNCWIFFIHLETLYGSGFSFFKSGAQNRKAKTSKGSDYVLRLFPKVLLRKEEAEIRQNWNNV